MKKWKKWLSIMMTAAMVLGGQSLGAIGVSAEGDNNVAQIGDTGYTTLAGAFSGVVSGQTITLLENASVSSMITLDKSITLDLNGHKASKDDGNSFIQIINGATLTVNGTTTNSELYGRINLGIASNNNGSAVLTGGYYHCTNNQTVLHINGTCLDSNVTITDATITSPTDNGIQLNGKGSFKIVNSTITGATAVYVKAGDLTIENSALKGTMNPANYSYWGNGANATGDALVVDACNYPGGDPSLHIKGGSYIGTKAAIGYYQYDGGKASLDISSGNFSSDPSIYVSDACKAYKNSDNTYSVISSSGEMTESYGIYEINNLSNLTWFANRVNAGESFSGKTFKLMSDINFNHAEWVPIGIGHFTDSAHNTKTDPDRAFEGIFDGQNHTISNFSVSQTPAEIAANTGLDTDKNASGNDYKYNTDIDNLSKGLFGYVNNGTIKNLKVSGAAVTGWNAEAAVIGTMGVGTVDNVDVDASTVTGAYENAGAVIGRQHGNITIKNCDVSGCTIHLPKNETAPTAKNQNGAGGLIGRTQGGTQIITNNTVTGTNITAYRKAAGLIGYILQPSSIKLDGNAVTSTTVTVYATNSNLDNAQKYYGVLFAEIQGVGTRAYENFTTLGSNNATYQLTNTSSEIGGLALTPLGSNNSSFAESTNSNASYILTISKCGQWNITSSSNSSAVTVEATASAPVDTSGLSDTEKKVVENTVGTNTPAEVKGLNIAVDTTKIINSIDPSLLTSGGTPSVDVTAIDVHMTVDVNVENITTESSSGKVSSLTFDVAPQAKITVTKNNATSTNVISDPAIIDKALKQDPITVTLPIKVQLDSIVHAKSNGTYDKYTHTDENQSTLTTFRYNISNNTQDSISLNVNDFSAMTVYTTPPLTVTFNTNGGSTVSNQYVLSGEKLTKPADPTKSGYTFSGWYKESALTNLWNFDNDTVTGNTTLYAKWTAVPVVPATYKVSFDANGGTGTMDAVSVTSGSDASLPEMGFTYTGHNFLTWNTAKDGSGTSYRNGGKVAAVKADVTLYAQWVKAPTSDGKLTGFPGDSRYETMEMLVDPNDYDAGGSVVIANGEGYADALAAAGFAGLKKAPIILTEKGSLSNEARALIQALTPTSVYIAGGETAVAPEVVDAVKAIVPNASFKRFDGVDRFDTAMKIYAEGRTAWSKQAIIVDGENYADALSIAPYAYASGSPIFLSSEKSALNDAALKAINGGAFTNAIIAGGENAVPESVDGSDVKIPSTRFNGKDRYDTCSEFDAWAVGASNDAIQPLLKMTYTRPAVSTGIGFADALAGSAYCGSNNSVLLLADEGNLECIEKNLKDNASSVLKVSIFGGTNAVPDTVRAAVKAAIG